MIAAGFVQSSRLLHPFNQPDDMDDGDLPPPSVAELAPLLDEFLDDPGHLRIFLPDNNELKFRIMRVYHDSPLGMHRRRDNTYHALARDFYWKGMGKTTTRWVARCQECIKHKSADQQHGLMHPRFYDKQIEVLGIDFVGPFPKSANGNRYILTAVCPLSHFLVAILTADRTATTGAMALFDISIP